MDELYEWIRNLTYYMLLVQMVLHMLPNGAYQKYVRFFAGLLLVLLISEPIFSLLRIKDTFDTFYYEQELEQHRKEIEDAARYLEEFTKSEEIDE